MMMSRGPGAGGGASGQTPPAGQAGQGTGQGGGIRMGVAVA